MGQTGQAVRLDNLAWRKRRIKRNLMYVVNESIF